MSLKIVAITGGIACGKTKATCYLQRCGYYVIDCDVIYHQLLQKNDKIPRALMESNYFPQSCFNIDVATTLVSLNKMNLREFLFNSSSSKNLQQLGNITHPFIFAEVKKQIDDYQKDQGQLTKHNRKLFKNTLFIAVPLLFERWSVWQLIFDEVWSIEVNEMMQRKRLKRRCIQQQTLNSLQTMYNIIHYQASAKDRRSIATITIDNNGKPWQMLKKLKTLNIKH